MENKLFLIQSVPKFKLPCENCSCEQKKECCKKYKKKGNHCKKCPKI